MPPPSASCAQECKRAHVFRPFYGMPRGPKRGREAVNRHKAVLCSNKAGLQLAGARFASSFASSSWTNQVVQYGSFQKWGTFHSNTRMPYSRSPEAAPQFMEISMSIDQVRTAGTAGTSFRGLLRGSGGVGRRFILAIPAQWLNTWA